MFNVHSVDANGALSSACCLCDMDQNTASHYAAWYADKYVGKPYPNGKGVYPWVAFITMSVEDFKNL